MFGNKVLTCTGHIFGVIVETSGRLGSLYNCPEVNDFVCYARPVLGPTHEVRERCTAQQANQPGQRDRMPHLQREPTFLG